MTPQGWTDRSVHIGPEQSGTDDTGATVQQMHPPEDEEEIVVAGFAG